MQKTIKGNRMILRKLKREEHIKTRKLWKEIFEEDTEQFLDYYYSVKTRENEIFVAEDEEIIAMLHLNPYDVRVNENIHLAHYIVAVATDARYRRRGIMGQLLKYAMRTMYDRKEPFTFLMPAAEAIYYPYDFRYIYSRKQGGIVGENVGNSVEIVFAEADDCGKLAEFANALLEPYQVAAYRDAKYYRTLIAEQQSENGQVVMIQKHGKLVGSFCYAKGESFEIREPLFYEEEDFKQAVYLLTQDEKETVKCIDYGDEKQPIIMARILHLDTFLRCLQLQEDVDICLELQDNYIEENNGVFHIVGTVRDGITLVERQESYQGECISMPIGAFTTEIFRKYLPKVFLNEVV